MRTMRTWRKIALLTTSARIKVSKASRDSERRTLRVCRSAAKHVPTVAVMCAAIETSMNADVSVAAHITATVGTCFESSGMLVHKRNWTYRLSPPGTAHRAASFFFIRCPLP